MTRTDAQIAREWAETNANAFTPTPLSLDQRNAIAAHILATTPAPTMADVEWDDAVHVGLCALYANGDLVRMIGPDLDNEDTIICHYIHYGSPVTVGLLVEKLTPLPGTRLDLTPRRPEDVPDDSPLIPEDDWRYASDATVALWHRLVPESTPDHPTVLTTKEDYESAPEGTIVAGDFCFPRVKDDRGFWLVCGDGGGETSRMMAFAALRVLRWGETL